MTPDTGIVVVGAGIVGLAVARALHERFPSESMILLEKEAEVGHHQTGHNSGVIHSGVYYRPGSAKAKLCVDGRTRMVEYIRSKGLPFEQCGKLVVATSSVELDRLRILRSRAEANGVPGIKWVAGDELGTYEPEVSGVAGLWVPGTGVTDYRIVAESLERELADDGVETRLRNQVRRGRIVGDRIRIESTEGVFDAKLAVNCAGLFSDRVASSFGLLPPISIVPFRGEYYHLGSGWDRRIRGLIYPVPDPVFPFLDVHFTRRIGGGIEAGPNAVWALSREGYGKTDMRLGDVADAITYPGFLRLTRRQLRTGVYEMFRSVDRNTFSRDLQKMVPAIRPGDLGRGGSGVRATAIAPDGSLVDDFVFLRGPRSIHVLNAVSPAATASLAIGEEVARNVPVF
jgi:L-2-hydroxyglutarate oxidase LhgO